MNPTVFLTRGGFGNGEFRRSAGKIMISDFQTIAEPLIKVMFPTMTSLKRLDECREVVHLEFLCGEFRIRLSWEPFGPPWAQIVDAKDKIEFISHCHPIA